MAEPTKDLEKLRKEQEREDASLLANLEKESKEFDKDSEIDRIIKSFRANAYDVLDLAPGVPAEDIKKTYRRKSLLIHPDKSSNPNAQDAFDRLAQAYQVLLDDEKRAKLDEAIADARMLLIRERKLTTDSEEVKDPDKEFMTAWKEKVKVVLAEMEVRKRRQMKAQMQEEGREQRKAEELAEQRKRKAEHDKEWEKTRDDRIGTWRDFQKKSTGGVPAPAKASATNGSAAAKPNTANGAPKKKKMKVLG